MFTIILFFYFNTIFIHKITVSWHHTKRLQWKPWLFLISYSWTQTRTSDYFSFPYTWLFCKLTGTSRVKSFSSCHTDFSIMRVLCSKFSANAMVRSYLLLQYPSFISGVFTLLNWRKFLLFIILLIDERVIPFYSAILRGARCVCGVSTCVNSSIKLAFASVVTDLGRPDPSFLFMVPLSLKRFKSLFMDV